MKVLVTGGSGFVGSNLVHVLRTAGDDVLAPSSAELDVTDADAVLAYAEEHRPDAVVHAAIWNAFAGLLSDRHRAWDSFVGATTNVRDAAESFGARMVLVSTDWVFDGSQPLADEDEPPNPTTPYGVLKVVCEQIVATGPGRWTVARIAGVQGAHRARATTVREQDAGFGYLVASAIDTLRAGRDFTVWEGPELNTIASPVSAIDASRLIRRAIEVDANGTYHCCGREAIDRVTLVRRAAEAFGFDPARIRTGLAPADAVPVGGAPYDTSLATADTALHLEVDLPDVDALLENLKEELAA